MVNSPFHEKKPSALKRSFSVRLKLSSWWHSLSAFSAETDDRLIHIKEPLMYFENTSAPCPKRRLPLWERRARLLIFYARLAGGLLRKTAGNA